MAAEYTDSHAHLGMPGPFDADREAVVQRALDAGVTQLLDLTTRVEEAEACIALARAHDGVHAAVGGPHDAPTPGDLLCAALAACLDSTLRMVANLLGVELESLQVTVTGDVDVRGTLVVDREVPVGFQAMRCQVALRPRAGTDPALAARLEAAAEHSYVVLQTLRRPPTIETRFETH